MFLDLRQLIESERASSSESRHLRSQETPSSVSGSYYTDSYLDGSKNETSSSSNGMESTLTRRSRLSHRDCDLSLISQTQLGIHEVRKLELIIQKVRTIWLFEYTK